MATVGPSRPTSCAARSLVVVFPTDPVMPAMDSPGSASVTARASLARAAGTSGVSSAGTPAGRLASTATAPAATAAAAKSCPSTCWPGSAANSVPGIQALRESITTESATAPESATRSGVAPVGRGESASEGQRHHRRLSPGTATATVAGERVRGNLPVVKGEHGAPNILAALMTLARYHQHISLVCHRDGQIDGRSSIGLYDDPCPL